MTQVLRGRLTAADLMARHPFVVTSALSVGELRRRFRHAHARLAVVVDGSLCVGVIDRHDLEASFAGEARQPEVRSIWHLVSVTPAVSPDTGLDGLRRALESSSRDAVLVLDDAGQLLGLVTAADLPDLAERPLPC